MRCIKLKQLPGVKLIELGVFADHRGFYLESFNSEKYLDRVSVYPFVQDDFSISKFNVLRGIHGDNLTNKLVSCISGRFQLVVVDPKTKKHASFIMKAPCYLKQDEMFKQLYVPSGYGIGHLVLTSQAIFHYKQTTYYRGAEEQFTIRYDDPKYNIPWLLDEEPILSQRDKEAKYE